MAGDWIKMRTSLLTNPKVNGIARILEESRYAAAALTTGYSGTMNEIVTRNVMRHVTVSSLLVIWGAANEHTRDGIFANADLSDIDDMVGIPGFAEAMVSVGWLHQDADTNSLTLPNFNEYNTSGSERSAGAKTAAQRQKDYRDRKKALDSGVTRDVTSDVTSNRREEKRREEKNIEEAPPSRSVKALGSRLSEDWVLPPEWQEWAEKERPDLNIGTIASGFRDFWVAKPGKDGRKADWQATWRNWVRNQRQQTGRPPAAPPAWAGAR